MSPSWRSESSCEKSLLSRVFVDSTPDSGRAIDQTDSQNLKPIGSCRPVLPGSLRQTPGAAERWESATWAGIDIWKVYLVNARETKNLPGRKSDVQESQWRSTTINDSQPLEKQGSAKALIVLTGTKINEDSSISPGSDRHFA
jgi:hypothetical protein